VDPRPRLGHADLLTVGDVADELRVSPTTVRRLIRRGELRAHALGSQYRITREDLDTFLAGARE
jgi:excisionase family DNA binding protein